MGKVIITKRILILIFKLFPSLLVKHWYRINIFSLTVYVVYIKIIKKILNRLCNKIIYGTSSEVTLLCLL